MPDASDRRYYSAPSRGHASEQVASLQKQKQRRPRQQRRAVSGYAMKLCTVGACCICVLFYEEMKNMLGVNRAQQRVVENGKPASKQRPKGARQASHASERKAPRLTFDQVVEQASRGLGLVNNGTSNSCGLAGRSNVSFMIVGDWGHHPGTIPSLGLSSAGRFCGHVGTQRAGSSHRKGHRPTIIPVKRSAHCRQEGKELFIPASSWTKPLNEKELVRQKIGVATPLADFGW